MSTSKRDTALAALAEHGGSVRQAALSLGIARSTLRAWRDLPANDDRPDPGPAAPAARIDSAVLEAESSENQSMIDKCKYCNDFTAVEGCSRTQRKSCGSYQRSINPNFGCLPKAPEPEEQPPEYPYYDPLEALLEDDAPEPPPVNPGRATCAVLLDAWINQNKP